jgi:hypothetical protein
VISDSRPYYRSILAVDIEDSATRNNSAKAHMRAAMYDLVIEAFALSGLAEHDHDPFTDRGDGILALIHPTDHVPKTVLLDTVVPGLSQLMTLHNLCYPTDGFRLRAVLHAGEVHHDGRAPFGEALDVAFRLLDARETKLALRRSTAPLMLVVSEQIFQTVVRHRYAGIDPLSFSPFDGRAAVRGWLHAPTPAMRAAQPLFPGFREQQTPPIEKHPTHHRS